MRIVVSALLITLAAFVLWGIGSAMRRLAGVAKGRWAVSVGIGLATLVAAGGILNLAHAAYRPVLWALIALGILIAVNEARLAKLSFAAVIPHESNARMEMALAAFVIAAMMLFTIATQLPPREFNYHDDLEKYLAHPVRIVETGTVAGSPLSALGAETLGGQAFLQAIVLSAAPLGYVNGVDAVFCLLALMLLAASVAWRRFGWFPGAALGAIMVALINPLYANIAGLYSGSVLMATAVLLVADESEEPAPLLLGIVYAALVAIKPTFALFPIFHVLLSAPSVALQTDSWKRALAWIVRVTAWSTATIACWIAVYLPAYLKHGTLTSRATIDRRDLGDVTLLGGSDVFDGDRIASYTAIAALAAFVAFLALWAWWASRANDQATHRPRQGKPLGLFAGAAAGVCCYLVVIFYIPLLIGYYVSVRYSVPFLLGTCVISALLAPTLLGKLPRAACVLIPAIACLAIAASFVPAALDRYQQARDYGSILEFPPLAQSPAYVSFMQYCLSDAARTHIEGLQAKVPPGEALLAWIETPYLLNYGRNHIVDVDTAGTANSWARIPPGVHYYLWQFKGYAVRTESDYTLRARAPGVGERDRLIARRALEFANSLSGLTEHAQVLASDDQFVLFRVDASAP